MRNLKLEILLKMQLHPLDAWLITDNVSSSSEFPSNKSPDNI